MWHMRTLASNRAQIPECMNKRQDAKINDIFMDAVIFNFVAHKPFFHAITVIFYGWVVHDGACGT